MKFGTKTKEELLFSYYDAIDVNKLILVLDNIPENAKEQNTLEGLLKHLGISPEEYKKMSGADLDRLLEVEKKVYEDDPDTRRVQEYMRKQNAELQDAMRKQIAIWRIGQEAKERQAAGWYPFFISLTLDPKVVPDTEKFWREGKQLDYFIEKLTNHVTDAMGEERIRKSRVKRENYLVWHGRLEHGKSREHHHCHMLVWMRDIPSDWKIDPNQGIKDAEYRVKQRCLQIEAEWEYSDPGRSPAIYFRALGDVWKTKHNFVLPVVEKGKDADGMPRREPLRLAPIQAAGLYISKYFTKDKKEWAHRSRGTRDLGTATLKQLIRNMPEEHLRQLAIRPPERETAFEAMLLTSVPLYYVRDLAKDEKYHRDACNAVDHPEEMLKESNNSFRQISEYVAAGLRLHRMSAQAKHEMLTEVLPPVPDYYDPAKYISAAEYLAETFPPVPKAPENPTLLGGI